MKKPTLILAMAAGLFLFNCKKDDTTYNAYFYATKTATDVPLSLYIDGKYQGELPYSKSRPLCGSDSLQQKTLFLTLKSGKYEVTAKDNSGNVKSTGKISFSKSKTSSSGGIGGQEVSLQNECLAVGFFY